MRRIIVHDLSQADTAAAAAADLGVTVELQSPPGAAGCHGPGFFAALPVVLDCGDAPGLALAALRAGVKRIRLCATPDVLARIADIAGQCGAILDQDDEPALDLERVPPPRRAALCRDWLLAPSDTSFGPYCG